jgi:hypothetical protein
LIVPELGGHVGERGNFPALTFAAGGVFEGFEDCAGDGGTVLFESRGESEFADGGGVERRCEARCGWRGLGGPFVL